LSILFLGYSENKIIDFLSKENDVVVWDAKVNSEFVSQFDYVISYGYTHILKEDIINSSKNGIINLHISYLPWNRGAHPNFWSFTDNTKKGVTIHYVDKGIDTGDIIFQKEIEFDIEEDTFEKTYNKLKKEIELLFIDNWKNIITKNYKLTKQDINGGSFHLVKDLDKYSIETWNTKIKEVINMSDFDIIDKIEKVRTKNNVNWMDILRLAMTHAPKDAKALVKKINNADMEISELLGQLAND